MAKRGTPEFAQALDDLLRVLAKALVEEYLRTGKKELPEPLAVFQPVADAASKVAKLPHSPYDGKRMLPLNAVIGKVGMGRDTIYRWVREGTFPKPLKLGRATRWYEHEIDTFLANATRKGDTPPAANNKRKPRSR